MEEGGPPLLAGAAAAPTALAPSPPLPYLASAAASTPVPCLDAHTIAAVFADDGDDGDDDGGVHGQAPLTFDVSLGWDDEAVASHILDA